MNKFRKPHGKRRDEAGARGGNDRPSFGRRPDAGFSRPSMQKFEATCSHCGKRCEVPFRPDGRKPVYCKDCFNRPRSESSAPASFPSREHAPRPQARDSQPNPELMNLARQVEAIQAKLDALLQIVSSLKKEASPAEAKPRPTPLRRKKIAAKTTGRRKTA